MADQSDYLEISLVVGGELAEAVSDVLTRFLPNGVVIEQAVRYTPTEDTYTPGELARVCGYIPVDEHLETKRTKIEEALWYLGRIQPLPEIHYQTIQNQNWMEKWKEHYHPILVGEKLLILPPWLDNPNPERIPIRIDPNMAFGTGTHPTTQLCLSLLEKHLDPDKVVIDIGCGSGILSIAARLMDARKALAVDIDPLSVTATQDNALLNGVGTGLETGLGSVKEVVQGDYSVKQAGCVLANILAPIIIDLFGEGLANVVEPGGCLILSGILDHQAAKVIAAAESKGLILKDQAQIEDWIALAMVKPIA